MTEENSKNEEKSNSENATEKAEFYKTPMFIAACTVGGSLLLLPLFVGGVTLFNLFNYSGDFIPKALLMGALITSFTLAYAIYDGGKTKNLDPEKLKWAPFVLIMAFIVYGIIKGHGIGYLGIGLWLALAGSIFISFEEQIKNAINKK